MQTFEKSATASVAQADTGGFIAYASKFLNIDRQGDIITPGAYSKALPEFLDDGGVILADHTNSTTAIAATLLDATEDRNGLLIQGQFSATDTGQRIRQQVMEKSLRKLSARFTGFAKRAKESDIYALWNRYNFSPSENQKKLAKSGANIIYDVNEILEISFIPVPANPGAEVISVKSLDLEIGNKTPAPVVQAESLLQLLHRADLADSILTAKKR